MPKVCIVATSPYAIRAFMSGHIRALSERYAVTVLCNSAGSEVPMALPENVSVVSLAIERDISPWRDCLALLALFRIFVRERFDVVHSLTPKAGLVAQLAAWVARIPCRIHIFTGQVWATRHGLMRFVLMSIDRLYAACATHILVDSPSQLNFLVEQHVVRAGKGVVLGKGSIAGVDIDRFAYDYKVRAEWRGRLGIPDEGVVFLYIGRLVRDKGVLDLASAFVRHAGRHKNTWLVMAGPDEGMLAKSINELSQPFGDRVRIVGYTAQPEQFMTTADALCLPSYREGFGSVILEAAACGVPAIASRIYGITDAVQDGETGLLHEPGDIEGMASSLDYLAQDHDRRISLGEMARYRAIRDFSAHSVTTALMKFYEQALSHGRSGGLLH